ncbi:hypothetical protein LINPERHAP2_LOCUS6394 [Linum perenne]
MLKLDEVILCAAKLVSLLSNLQHFLMTESCLEASLTIQSSRFSLFAM